MTSGKALLLAALALALVSLAPERALALSKRRAVPAYDGRAPAPTTAGEVALWAPRLVLFPVHLTTEYVLRRPMGALVTTAERDQWPKVLADFFTFGKDHEAGIVPTALIDFGFRPSVGVYAFWDGAFARGNDLRFRAATGGTDWLAFGVADHVALSKGATATLRLDWTRRPDGIYAGVGPRTLESDVTRFSADRAEGAVEVESALGGQSAYRASVGLRNVVFGDAGCCDDPALRARVASGAVASPAGFDTGYSVTFQRIEIALDTRHARPTAGSGVRLEATLGQFERIDAAGRAEWTEYGGAVGGLWDVTKTGRVLSVWVAARFVDPWRDAEVPFTELVHLGGTHEMRGFKDGRLVGRSAAVATLQHEWPIWVGLHGTMQVAMGNVFGPHLSGIDSKLLRGSAAAGFRTAGSTDHYLEVLVGTGTETIEDGFHPTSIRLLIGGNHGF